MTLVVSEHSLIISSFAPITCFVCSTQSHQSCYVSPFVYYSRATLGLSSEILMLVFLKNTIVEGNISEPVSGKQGGLLF